MVRADILCVQCWYNLQYDYTYSSLIWVVQRIFCSRQHDGWFRVGGWIGSTGNQSQVLQTGTVTRWDPAFPLEVPYHLQIFMDYAGVPVALFLPINWPYLLRRRQIVRRSVARPLLSTENERLRERIGFPCSWSMRYGKREAVVVHFLA